MYLCPFVWMLICMLYDAGLIGIMPLLSPSSFVALVLSTLTRMYPVNILVWWWVQCKEEVCLDEVSCQQFHLCAPLVMSKSVLMFCVTTTFAPMAISTTSSNYFFCLHFPLDPQAANPYCSARSKATSWFHQPKQLYITLSHRSLQTPEESWGVYKEFDSFPYKINKSASGLLRTPYNFLVGSGPMLHMACYSSCCGC